jgi:hypothetical protein
MLEGRPAVISFVTVAELEYGARLAGWGPDRFRRDAAGARNRALAMFSRYTTSGSMGSGKPRISNQRSRR